MVEVRVSLRNVLLSACLVSTLAGTARADDDSVVGRLSSNGGLSTSAAKKLVSRVNVRMAKAADATAGANDPMRAAVSLALFQAPTPPNSMAAAKVRLRLYAGLNEWALESIFAPQPGVIAGCVREVGASQSECEALVAAAAKSTVAHIRSVAGGSAAPVAAAPVAPAYGGAAPAANGGGRFGRFSSGYQAAPAAAPRYGAAPAYGYPQQQQQYARPMPPQQQYGYQQQYARPAPQQYAAPQQQYARPAPQQQYARPAPQQQYAAPQQQYAAPQQQYARPVAPVAPPAPVVSPQEAQSRKDAYKAQREAYLARQKAQFEDKKQKMSAMHQQDAAEAPPRNGVETSAPAQAAAPMSKPTATASAAKAPSKAAAAADDSPSEPVAAKSGTKPALDNDFLDGLLDDPLANKKGK
jgi:hypothetical protein